MRRTRCLAILTLAGIAPLVASAKANAVAIMLPQSNPTQQAIQADVIVVGKVTEIEKEMSQASPFQGAQNKVDYHVGVIKISDSILGAKGLTTIRVGYLPAPKIQLGPIGGPALAIQPIRRPPIRQQQVTLTEGQEGCFFLFKHHDGDFYTMQNFSLPLDKKVADFDKKLDGVKKVVKMIDDPMSGLKAKDAADRQEAAHILIQRYRSYPPNVGAKQPKQDDIAADQSKLILQIMSEMEWGKFEQKDGFSIGVQNMFGMLGIQQGQQGFNPPKFQPGQNDYGKVYGEYVMKWIKDNSDKYHIQKWVAVR
jgi:hypothetical protein